MLKYKICVIMSDIRDNKNVSYLTGIEKAASALGFSTVAYSMLQSSELFSNGEEQIFELINFDDYDGVIILATSFGAHENVLKFYLDQIHETCNLPIVSIGKSDYAEVLEFDESGIYAEKMVDHIIEEHGCKNIYILGGTKNTITNLKNGVQDSFDKHGMKLHPNNFIYGGYWIDCAEKLAKDIASEAVAIPDAVFCISEQIARAFIDSMYQYSYRIPEDIIVACVDRSPDNFGDIIPITMVSYNGDIRGYNAMAALYNRITGLTAPEKRIQPPVLTTGVSCGCGVKAEKNTRFKFEQKKTMEHAEMLFRNSYIEEKLYSVSSIEEFADELKKLTYLVQRKRGISVSILSEDKKTATSINVTEGQNGVTTTSTFIASDLYPDEMTFEGNNESTFTYVLPLIFNGKMRGFMTIIYDDPIVYDKIALRFAKIVSIGIERLKQLEEAKKSVCGQENTLSHTNTQEESAESVSNEHSDQPTNTNDDINIFANKDGVMCKVVIENILYFEAINSKIHIALKSGKYEIKQKLFEIEDQLKTRGFIRISKSMVLNMKKVLKFRPGPDRTIIVTLSNNEEIRVSRKYFDDFKERITI